MQLSSLNILCGFTVKLCLKSINGIEMLTFLNFIVDVSLLIDSFENLENLKVYIVLEFYLRYKDSASKCLKLV